MIRQCDPGAGYRAHKEAIDAAIQQVLDSGWYILGEQVRQFEAAFAKYIGSRYAVGVANGTDALELALRALDVTSGDRVVTVSHTAVATIAAIARVGARPVFVDIDPATMTLDPNALAMILEQSSLTPCKAIIVVHLYGQPAAMAAINAVAKAFAVPVIEDCAQAHGASIGKCRVGGWGHIGCFSMYPTKNLAALGDAGAVVTNSEALFQQLLLLRQYGWKERFVSSICGVNSRLDEIQAAVLCVRLVHLNQDNLHRQAIAKIYQQCLQDSPLELPITVANTTHVFHQYVVRSPCRDVLIQALQQQGVACAIHYPFAVHQQPAYQCYATALPHTEAAVANIMSLPIYPELPLSDARIVGDALAALL